ncbi:Tctex-1, partial [Phycomyces blakesleeanus]
FNSEEVTAIIKETMESVLLDVDYAHGKVPSWNSTIIDNCLKKLKDMNKNYKYVVTCVIMQKNGAGFYAGSSVYWDNLHDGKSYYHFTSNLDCNQTKVLLLTRPCFGII